VKGFYEPRLGAGVVVVVVVGERLGPDEVRLEEAVSAAATHRQDPANQRAEEEPHQYREGDGEDGEEFVEVQVHRQDALESIRQRIALLLRHYDAGCVNRKCRVLRPGGSSEYLTDDPKSVIEDVHSWVVAEKGLEEQKLDPEHDDVQDFDHNI